MAEKTHHIIYKTTNKINGKIYIGIHSTSNLNDGYLGSGRLFLKALKKYGKDNFKREILFDLPTRGEAEKKEEIIVCEEFVKNNNNYNVALGGRSGNGLSNKGRKHTPEAIQKIIQAQTGMKLSEETRYKISKAHKGKKLSPEVIEKQRIGRNKFYQNNTATHKGYKHSEESKKKISEAHKGNKFSKERRVRHSELLKGKSGLKGKPVIDTETGVVYQTITKASIELNIKPRTLWRNIKKENYHIKYYLNGE